jgi:small-conductance mechanosensitive channel
MILENLIPTAYAQAASAATKTATQATETGITGVQRMLEYIMSHIGLWIGSVIIIFASAILAKMLAARIRNHTIEKRGEEVPENLLVLIDRVTKWCVVGLGIIIALAINGLNFAAVIGAFSLGIGFALKDVISNFISSIMMLAQNYIRIGDLIEVGGVLGTVKQINTRVSILQTFDGQDVLIPNQTILNSSVTNYTKNPFRRINVLVGVDYKSDLHMVTSLIRGVIYKDPDFVPKPAPMVVIEEFGSSSIQIRAFAWIETGKSPFITRSNLAYRIKKALDECGVNIPFNITTFKIDEDDRAFLKTMESFKKGYIPEAKKSLTEDGIKVAAEKTSDLEKIPHEIFKDKTLAEVQNVAKPEPQPTTEPAAVVPEKELVLVGATAPVSSGPELKAPPSHL